MPIQQITIVGTGLIGGSLGLALRQAGFSGTIVGCDKRAVLEIAEARNAIDRGKPIWSARSPAATSSCLPLP
jgi:prephenate dehydrogenase